MALAEESGYGIGCVGISGYSLQQAEAVWWVMAGSDGR